MKRQIKPMQRFFLLLTALFTYCGVWAQTPVYFYGVDFSQVKVYGANEPVSSFKNAFESINYLLISEQKKYDFEKVLGVPYQIDLSMVFTKLHESSFEQMKVMSWEMPPFDSAQYIRQCQFPNNQGVGLLLVARLLDKANAGATYELLLCDLATHEIIYQKEVYGVASGFGLRNYWANTISRVIKYNPLKLLKKKK